MYTKNYSSQILLLCLVCALILLPSAAFAHESDPNPDNVTGLSYSIFVPFADTGTSASETPIPPSTDTFRFVSWGDTRGFNPVLETLSKQVKPLSPVFTIYLGDLEGEGFTAAGIAAWREALDGGSNNGTFEITFPIRGNHDSEDLPGWQSYFDIAGNAQRIGAANFTDLSEDTTYAFEYKNAIFIGLDVPEGMNEAPPGVIDFLDDTLDDAESRGLTHAFIYMHIPLYLVANHNTCTERACPVPSSTKRFIAVLNEHPIISAVFHGHEHLQSYVHMDKTRISEITHPYEQITTGGGGAFLNQCDQSFRFNYCGAHHGFAAVDVSGHTFTVKFYQKDSTNAVKTFTFSKD